MSDLREHAKALLAELKKGHEMVDLKEPHIKHFLKKLTDGRIELTEQERAESIKIFKNLRSTLIELSPSVTKLTKLVDGGLTLLKKPEGPPHSCRNLKLSTYETDDTLLGAELRTRKGRVVLPDSGIGSFGSNFRGSNVPSGSYFHDNKRSSVSATEHEDETFSDNTVSAETTNDLARNSSICKERLGGMDFQNLSLGSMQSNSCNEETVTHNEDVLWDEKFGPVSGRPPERDSVAFAHAIPEDEVSSIDAQGQSAHEQRRHKKRTDNSVVVMKDHSNDDKESDV